MADDPETQGATTDLEAATCGFVLAGAALRRVDRTAFYDGAAAACFCCYTLVERGNACSPAERKSMHQKDPLGTNASQNTLVPAKRPYNKCIDKIHQKDKASAPYHGDTDLECTPARDRDAITTAGREKK